MNFEQQQRPKQFMVVGIERLRSKDILQIPTMRHYRMALPHGSKGAAFAFFVTQKVITRFQHHFSNTAKNRCHSSCGNRFASVYLAGNKCLHFGHGERATVKANIVQLTAQI